MSSRREDGSITEQNVFQENQQLRRQLKAFLAKVRQNEDKFAQIQKLELGLIKAQSLPELIEKLVVDYPLTKNLDEVSLILVDEQYELRKVLLEKGFKLEHLTGVSFVENDYSLGKFFHHEDRPRLGPFNPAVHSQWFRSQSSLGSVCMLPMYRDGKLVGSINLGSREHERFSQSVATDFLQRLSTITSVCLRNVTNSERLERLGLTDVLTGVNNRRFFDQRLVEEVSLAARNQTPVACLFFDVDYFKQINDQYGHQTGDIVLREIAAMIRMNLRTSDVLARYGGEEFSALLPQTGLEEAVEIAERVRQSIAGKLFQIPNAEPTRVTVSIGATSAYRLARNENMENLALRLVNGADQCVYKAKEGGRNRVCSEELDVLVAE